MSADPVSRREFLKTSATVAAVAAVPVSRTLAEEANAEKNTLVPTRPLGKTGVNVSILGMGAAGGATPRQLNLVKSEGIRYLDTADCYQNGRHERDLGEWLKTEKRSDWFVVSKDHPRSPQQWIEMLDRRLEALQTDYLDLYFIHMLGDREYHDHDYMNWPVAKEWKEAAEAIKKSGKARIVGFSSHARDIDIRSGLLEMAGKDESWVEAIMVATSPLLVRENERFNKALDACHKKGVGLISMKESRLGQQTDRVKELVPRFEEMGLTSYGAVLTAVWSDTRFASILSAMDNAKKIRENVATAKKFKPLTKEQLGMVDELIREHNRTFCHACTGRCREAGGTTADLNSIARYLAYYEEQGEHAEARRLFAALPPEARDLSNIDTKAAHMACSCHLDFARIVEAAREKLA